jgi:hypothetical protein
LVKFPPQEKNPFGKKIFIEADRKIATEKHANNHKER